MAENTARSALLGLADDDSLKGRIIEINESGAPTVRGVITDIQVMDGSLLVIEVNDLMVVRYIDSKEHWEAAEPSSGQYSGAEGWATAFRQKDDTIHITAPMSWSGDILEAGSTLPEPTRR